MRPHGPDCDLGPHLFVATSLSHTRTSMSDSERSRRLSQPSSRASSSDEFRTLVPTVAASIGLPPPKAPAKTVAAPPPSSSNSAKRRKDMAQLRENATQPGPLPPGKRPRTVGNLLDRTYESLTTPTEQREWLLLALELRRPKIDFSGLSVEELEDRYGESTDEDADMEPTPDRATRGIIVESSKPALVTKASNRAMFQPQTTASSSKSSLPNPKSAVLSYPPPSQPATASAGKPGPKFSKAQVDKFKSSAANTASTAQKQQSSTITKSTPSQGLQIQSTRPSSSTSRPPAGGSKPRLSIPVATPASQPSASANSAARTRPINGIQKSQASNHVPRPASPIQANAQDEDHAAEREPGDANGDDPPEPVRTREAKNPTKKEEAQLCKFGDAAPIVSLAVDMIKARLAFVHPFPELIPSKVGQLAHESDGSDEDAVAPIARKMFTDWGERFYRQAHKHVRRGQSAIGCEPRHLNYMNYQLSQFRTQFKRVADAKVPSVYGLSRGDVASVAKAENLVQNDKFLSPTLENNIGRFKHEIFGDLIQAAFFDGPNSLGARYEELLDDKMPKETIAFAACIIRRVIKSYVKNDKASKTLAADADLAQFERYMSMLDGLPGSNQAVRLENIQMRLLDHCLKGIKGDDHVEPVDIPYEENDSEPDEDLHRAMHARKRRNRKKGKRREDADDTE